MTDVLMPSTQTTLTANKETGLAKFETYLAAIAATATGTGLPIPLTLADPGDDDWTAAIDPNPVNRACTRLRMYVGNSGMIVSFDGGVTEHVKLPLNTGDDVGIAIPSGSDVRIKRLTAGTAMTEIIVEVR